jgi:hypothetical protein
MSARRILFIASLVLIPFLIKVVRKKSEKSPEIAI